MGGDVQPYATAGAVDAAIKQAARTAHANDPSVGVSERIRRAYFDRFLCRVFSEGAGSEWLLKGGTGMLARVPDSRATRDVDLYRSNLTVDDALAELRRLAGLDLGEGFRFEYVGHDTSVGGEQPYAVGCRVGFQIYSGVNARGRINVDMVVSGEVTGEVEVRTPADRLLLPRLPVHDYRLYPVVDQIADKVCATVATYPTGPSTRERDLVDLVVLALTQDVSAGPLAIAIAIERESARRMLAKPQRFEVPSGWGRSYAKEISATSFAADYGSIERALELMRSFLDPVLRSETTTATWSPAVLGWR